VYKNIIIGTVIILILAQATFGEWFYKFNMFGVFPTELIVLILWAGIFFSFLKRPSFPKIPFYPFTALTIIFLVYLLISFSLDREIYWVVRQSTIILYFSVSILSFYYCHLVKFTAGGLSLDKLANLFGIAGVVLLLLHHFTSFVPGRASFASFLMFITGVAYWINNIRGSHKQIIFGLVVLLFTSLVLEHTSWLLSIAIVLLTSLYLKGVKTRIVVSLLSIIILIGVVNLVAGLGDANAEWRYMYWVGVLEESWDLGFGLLGQGFGITYMPEGYEAFERLIEQVGAGKSDYQLLTVPPHNSVLTILIYVGLPGVIVFFTPFIMAYMRIRRNSLTNKGKIVISIQVSMLFLLMSNQFLEVPYTSIIFWWFYGLMVFLMSESTLANSKYYNSGI
jgi:hypothetical protein